MSMYDPGRGQQDGKKVSFLEGSPLVSKELSAQTIEQVRRDLSLKRFPIRLPHEALFLDEEAYLALRSTVDSLKQGGKYPVAFDSFMWGAAMGYALAHRSCEPQLRRVSELEEIITSLRKRLKKFNRPNSSLSAIVSTPRKRLTPITTAEVFLAKYMIQFQEDNPNTYSL